MSEDFNRLVTGSKRQHISSNPAIQAQFDQQNLINTIGQVLEQKLEEKFNDRTKMETEIFERVKTSMLEVMQAETERFYKNLAVPLTSQQSEASINTPQS